jgi:DNA repair exonuclease SbcCD nuclease subunit
VVTERDRLVRAKEQLDLAEALHAPVFVVDGDHDSPLVLPKEFSTAVADAIDSVADRCPET